MSWRQAAKQDIPGVLVFLLRDEALRVPITSRMRAETKGCRVFFDTDKRGEVTDCLLHTVSGLLLPALSPREGGNRDLEKVIRGLRPAVHSIMGVGRLVQAVEALIPLSPTTRIEYFLMTLGRDRLPHALPPEDPRMLIRRADPWDAEALFPLQKAYELEEVAIYPSHFSDGQCMKLLKRGLREELTLFAERDGKVLAKAGTNARGYTVDQIGGVYTVPEERGKGLAKTVMVHLLRAIFQEKTTASLFVKKKNRPAIALYDRLGFEPRGDYVISYYGL